MSAAILDARLVAMSDESKIRSDAKVWHYTDEHFVAVVEWLWSGVPLRKVPDLIRKDLKLPPAKVPSFGRLSEFWSDYRPLYVAARRREAIRSAQPLQAEIAGSPLNLQQATIDALSQWAFELATEQNCDPKAVKGIFGILHKDQQLRLDREKLSASQRSKIEAGLEALRAEIEGNPKALAAWNQMKEALAK